MTSTNEDVHLSHTNDCTGLEDYTISFRPSECLVSFDGYTMELPKSLTPVQEFYAGKAVFLTGATGFMGTLILEKLLRSCPDVRRVYVLLRKGRSESIQTKLQIFHQAPIFAKLRREFPKFYEKITPIRGDLVLPNLGISQSDEETLIQDVQIVFHLAASTKFTEPLSTAINIILRGTLSLLELSRKMPNLQVFLHTSSLSVAFDKQCIEEKMYQIRPNWMSWRALLVDPDLNSKQVQIVQDMPNTYIFAKMHTEHMLEEMRGNIPIGIARPGAVMCTAQEPEPSWMGNSNLLMQMLTAVNMGVMRVVQMSPDKSPVIVPGDMSVSALLVCAWRTWTLYSAEPDLPDLPVFNHGTSRVELTAKQLFDSICAPRHAHPSFNVNARPLVVFAERQDQFEVLNLLLNIAPLRMKELTTENPQRREMIRSQVEKIQKLLKFLTWYTSRETSVECTNLNTTWHSLTAKDKELFKFCLPELNMEVYLQDVARGIRLATEEIQNKIHIKMSNSGTSKL